MGLLDKQIVYGWSEYPEAFRFWEAQESNHWLPKRVDLNGDLTNWKDGGLTEAEKQVIGRTLKGFVQAEVLIQDYWSTKVARWFKKVPIQLVARCFGSYESIHAVAYAYLQETLGLDDFKAFLAEPTAKVKIDRLIDTPGKSRSEIALSLAVFSAFAEGVSLFSSFAILFSFSRRNKMKGLAEIIRYSCLDEGLHSSFGCWLFREFVKDYPEVLTTELKAKILDAARLTVELEDDFIDMSFTEGDIVGLSVYDLKQYIRARTNSKLNELGLEPIYEIDDLAVQNLDWFAVICKSNTHQDFFDGHPNAYAIGGSDFSEIWD